MMALFTTNHIQIFEYWVASGVYNYSIKIIQLLFENENRLLQFLKYCTNED